MNLKYLWCLLSGHKWYYDEHIRGCLKCELLELVSTYPFTQEGPKSKWDWILFPDDLNEYNVKPSDQKVISQELFRFLEFLQNKENVKDD